MGKLIDLAGQTVGKWEVLRRCETPEGRRGPYWECRCTCEAKTVRPVSGASLVNFQRGLPRGSGSCGCSYFHGDAHSATHRSWVGMKTRCTNPKCPQWPHYGGKEPYPVRMCEGFASSYRHFKKVVGEKPSEELSIDRIKNDGPDSNYSCGQCEECLVKGWSMNVRWATEKEQRRNKTKTVKVQTPEGEVSALDYAENKGAVVSPRRFASRIGQGWEIEDALTEEIKEPERVEYEGRMWTIPELAKKIGIHTRTLRYRLGKGMSVEEAKILPVNTPNTKTVEWEGTQVTLAELSALTGVSYCTLNNRINKLNWEVRRAVETPTRKVSNCRKNRR